MAFIEVFHQTLWRGPRASCGCVRRAKPGSRRAATPYRTTFLCLGAPPGRWAYTCEDAWQKQPVNWSSFSTTGHGGALDADTIRRSLFLIDDKRPASATRIHYASTFRPLSPTQTAVYTRKGEDGSQRNIIYTLNAGVFMYETDAQVYEQARIGMNDVVRTFVNLLNSSLEVPKIFVVSKTVRHEEKRLRRLARATLAMGYERT